MNRHKMLCLIANKIMPERHFCQAFRAFFYKEFYDKKSMTYKIFASKYFKYRAKKYDTFVKFFKYYM